jgi:kynureninase
MSAHVDVLTPMRDVLTAMRVAEAYCYDAGAANAARNVKAARAELIAATDALMESADEGADRGSVADRRWRAAKDRVADALARCKGAQA